MQHCCLTCTSPTIVCCVLAFRAMQSPDRNLFQAIALLESCQRFCLTDRHRLLVRCGRPCLVPFAAPDFCGTRQSQPARCTRGDRVHIARERSAPTVATLSRRKCSSGEFSPYCHTTEPCQSVRCEALRRVLRKCSADLHAAHHQMTTLLVTTKTGCLGVLRMPSYSLQRRSPVLLGFPGLRRPVGVHLGPLGVGMCRFAQIHTASERLRPRCSSAPSRLGRDIIGAQSEPKRADRSGRRDSRAPFPVRPGNNRFLSDLRTREMTAGSYGSMVFTHCSAFG